MKIIIQPNAKINAKNVVLLLLHKNNIKSE